MIPIDDFVEWLADGKSGRSMGEFVDTFGTSPALLAVKAAEARGHRIIVSVTAAGRCRFRLAGKS